MKRLTLTLVMLMSLVGVACSEQTRTADPQITSEELMFLVQSMSQAAGVNGFSSTDAGSLDALVADQASTIYHAGSDGTRPAVSVISLNDVGFLDSAFSTNQLTILDIDVQYADAVFIDGALGGQDRRFALMLRLESYDGSVLYFNSMSEAGDYKFSDTSFETAVRGANGERLILRSNDLSKRYSQELASAVKLEIWVQENGQEFYLGQISTMAGFGGF